MNETSKGFGTQTAKTYVAEAARVGEMQVPLKRGGVHYGAKHGTFPCDAPCDA